MSDATEAGAREGSAVQEGALLLDVQGVATLLDCSPRSVYRLADRGAMPRPLKLGSLNRWAKGVILRWVAEGCPNCRRGGRR